MSKYARPVRPAELWAVPFGRARRIQVVGGVVLAHAEATTEAWDAATGQRLWSLAGHLVAGPADEAVLYTLADKKICAVDARTGEIRWEHKAPERRMGLLRGRGAALPPFRHVLPIPGGLVVAYGSAGVYALDAATGESRWAQPADFTGKAFGLGGLAADHRLERPLLTGSLREAAELAALDPTTGSPLWIRKHALLVPFPDGRACTISGRDSSGQHHLLDGTTGAMLGPVGTTSENPLGFPGLIGDTAVLRQDEFCERIDLATGTRIWRTQMRSISRCRTGRARGTVVADEAVYIPDEESSFHALDAADGAVLWHAVDVLAPQRPQGAAEVSSGAETAAPDAARSRLFGGPDTALAVGVDASTAFDRRNGRTLWTWADPDHGEAAFEGAADPAAPTAAAVRPSASGSAPASASRHVTAAAIGNGTIYLGGERRIFAVPATPAP